MNTNQNSLIAFHAGWGKDIRSKYDLWHNEALAKDLGADYPNDAAMIIKVVWKALREYGYR